MKQLAVVRSSLPWTQFCKIHRLIQLPHVMCIVSLIPRPSGKWEGRERETPSFILPESLGTRLVYCGKTYCEATTIQV